MLVTMARLYAYSRWPKTTFAVTHPKTTARLAKMRWDLKHAYAPRVSAVTTAVLALPFGYLVGRALRGSNREDEVE
ncbi:MAG: hypothetical protein ACRELV_09245 [Longimicrobiales bacterium]